MFPFAHQLGDTKEQLCALFSRNIAPALKGLVRRFNRLIREVFRSFVKLSYSLRSISWIDTFERTGGLNALAADNERIFATEFALNFVDRGAHCLRIFLFGEICKWFVSKFCWHDSVSSLRLSRPLSGLR